MADKKISALTSATTPLDGTEVLPLVQGSTTKQASVVNLTAGRAVSTLNITSTSHAAFGGNLAPYTGSIRTAKIGAVGLIFGDGSTVGFNAGIAQNVVPQNDGSYKYMTTSGAGVNLYIQSSGTHNFRRAVAGAAGATVPWVTPLTISTTDNITANLGNFVIGTSGKGIDFSADGQAAGMTSELLDDYEEGAFTPTASGITGDNTYAGTYTIIGNRCMWEIVITTTTSIGITGSGGSSLTPPVTPSNYSTCVAGEATTGGGYGTGLVNTSLIYPPTVAAGVVVIITGSFSVA